MKSEAPTSFEQPERRKRRTGLIAGGAILIMALAVASRSTLAEPVADDSNIPIPNAPNRISDSGSEVETTTTQTAILRADLSTNVRFGRAVDASRGAISPTTARELILPDVDLGESVSTNAYLTGDGAALIEFLVAVEGVWNEMPLDDAACTRVRQQLEAIASPLDLVNLAQELSDPPASEVLTSLVTMTSLVMSDCGTDPTDIPEIAWHWAVAYRRLAELGVDVP